MTNNNNDFDDSFIFEELFSNSYVAILIVGKDRNNILVNDRFCELFKYKKEDIIGKNASIFHKNIDSYNEFGKIAFNYVLEEKPMSLDYEFKKSDGSYFWAKISGNPLKNKKYVLWTIVDITENIKTKNKLEETTNRLNLALEASREGLWDWNLETNNLYLSPRWKFILGYEDNELENSFKTWEDLVEPEYKEKSYDILNRYLKNEIEYFEIFFEMRHKNGNIIPILSRAKKLFDRDGNISRIVGTHTDISDIKNIKDELNEQRSLLRTIIDEIPYPVVLKDYKGKFVLVNEFTARLYSSTPFEMIGKDDGDFIPNKEIANKMRENVIDIMNIGETQVVYEDSIDTKTNEVRNYMSVKKPFKNKFGEQYILVLAHDITDLTNKNKEIQEKEKLMFRQSKLASMGEMIGNIAHQWRQPLSLISSLATGTKLQKDIGVLDYDTLDSTLDRINDTTQYLSQTIDDFRNFFDPRNSNRVDFNIKNCISKALNLVEPQLNKYEIVIEKNIEDFELNTHENELIQVLLNIINNSKDAFEKTSLSNKRVILIKTFKDDKNGFIQISDSAGGIDEEIIDKIFDPYFTTKHQSIGTGVGLFMTEEIIVKHLDGEIFVENASFKIKENKYFGAKFEIKLSL